MGDVNENCDFKVSGTSRREKVIKGTASAYLEYGVRIILQILLAPLVLRFAGQEVLGVYAIITQAIGYLTLLDLGFSMSLNRFLPQAYAVEDDCTTFSQVMSISRTFLLFSNLAMSVACVIISLFIGKLFSLSPRVLPEAQFSMYILAAWMFLKTPWTVYKFGLYATQRMAAANLILAVSSSLRIVGSVVFTLMGLGIIGLIVAFVLSELVAHIAAYLYFMRMHPGFSLTWRIDDWQKLKKMVCFGLGALFVNLATKVIFFSDNIIAGVIFDAAAVSLLYVNLMPVVMGRNLINCIVDNAGPAINELHARNNNSSLRTAFLHLNRYALLAAAFLVVVVISSYSRIITVWVGSSMYGSDLMTFCLAGFSVLASIEHVGFVFFFAAGNINKYAWVVLLEAVLKVALAILLAKYMGLTGIVMASLVAHVIPFCYLQVWTFRKYSIKIDEYIRQCVVPFLCVVAACTLTLYFFRLFIRISDIETWYYDLLIILIGYGTSMYVLVLRPEEKRLVEQVLRSAAARIARATSLSARVRNIK